MDILKNRMVELSQEAERLVSEREKMYRQIGDIDTRLTQIVGAITELDKLLKAIIGESSQEDLKDPAGSFPPTPQDPII
jgi:predicted  nucleic acid-binding Zn-ribbon protein